jgi:hypothetical protein
MLEIESKSFRFFEDRSNEIYVRGIVVKDEHRDGGWNRGKASSVVGLVVPGTGNHTTSDVFAEHASPPYIERGGPAP